MTTLECMEGLRKYDSGAITVNGKMGIQLQSFLPSIMLSGIMFPIDLLPDFLEATGRTVLKKQNVTFAEHT